MGFFNSLLKFQKKFDPLSYHISKTLGIGVENPQQAATQSPSPPLAPTPASASSRLPCSSSRWGRSVPWSVRRGNRWVSHSPWVSRVRRGHWLVLHVFNNKQRSTHFARRRLLCSSG